MNQKKAPWYFLLLLILAGESVFILPFVLSRVFRPTVLDAFGLDNVQLGLCFSIYGTVALLSYLFGGPLADKFLIPGMMEGGTLAPYFGWLVGVGPGTGISLLWVFLGIIGFIAGMGGYLFREVRDVETILPDHDELQIPAES